MGDPDPRYRAGKTSRANFGGGSRSMKTSMSARAAESNAPMLPKHRRPAPGSHSSVGAKVTRHLLGDDIALARRVVASRQAANRARSSELKHRFKESGIREASKRH